MTEEERRNGRVDYNPKMLKQQYEPMTPADQYKLKMDALENIKNSDEDYCNCPEKCPHHGKCWECVLIHRGHRDHVPYCFWDMINERIYHLQRLTEGSLKDWQLHESGFVPRQYYHPALKELTEEKYLSGQEKSK